MKGPTLYRLASERRYESIVDHVKEHPDDIFWTDHHGSTALHILCQAVTVNRPLVAAVAAIIQEGEGLDRTNPSYAPSSSVSQKDSLSIIGMRNHATCTPLHYAAEKRMVSGGGGGNYNTRRGRNWEGQQQDQDYSYNGSTELVLLLLKHCPDAVSMRTQTGIKAGKTPFHIACEANADWRVLRAMLLINPGLATEPYVKKDVYSVAEHPLQLLWNNIHNNTATSVTANNTTTTTHDKMALLIRAAHYGTVDDAFHQGHPVRLLNAACSVRCPQDYFLQLLEQHADQVRELDERNLLPLHYAVEHASVESQAYSQFVIESLLELYPEAASVENEEGRLPLHVALMDSKLTWHKGGVQEIVFAYPDALRVRDPLYQLPPFLASAFHAIKSRLHLSTSFELLRTAPDVIESLIR